MPVRNPTVWTSPNGTGFTSSSTGAVIQTQGLNNLTTQAGTTITIQPQIHINKYSTSWTQSTKNKSKWQPANGRGTVVNVGNELILTNTGFNLADNLGNMFVSTPTYNTSLNTTGWNKSSKNNTSWNTPLGTGQVITIGTQYIITNDGRFIVTNNGNFIVTTPTYNKSKNLTNWTLSGI